MNDRGEDAMRSRQTWENDSLTVIKLLQTVGDQQREIVRLEGLLKLNELLQRAHDKE